MSHRLSKLVLFAASIALVGTAVSALPASADTAPPSGTPATVSADALPTAQINGVVWSQVIVGNKVYATGQFTQARPAGVAVGGAGSVTRSNLLAYDITTGVLDAAFVHTLTGTDAQGKSVAASPDGKRLVVGGKFTAVDGVAQSNLAIFDLTTNKLVKLTSAGPSNDVKAVAATNTAAYVGGSFSSAGGATRNKLAKYDINSGSMLANWAPAVSGVKAEVTALVVTPNQNNLVVGGTFNNIAGTTFYSLGAVNLDSGSPASGWATSSASFPIRDQIKSTAGTGSGTGITSLSTDNTNVYFTSYGFGSADLEAFFEGRGAISPTNGSLVFANDCHGDTYSSTPINGVLYSVGHAHDCQPMGLWPDGDQHRSLAETITPVANNVAPTESKYTNLSATKHTTQLDWYPSLAIGTYTGQSQAAWSITGNSTYVALGGEFPSVNGTAQQGLVRFAVKAAAPNKIKPTAYANGSGIQIGTATQTGRSFVSFPSTWDPDNAVLTYKVYRDSSTLVYTTTTDSRFWITRYMSFVDTGLAAGSRHTYRIDVTDPFGNSTSVTSAAASYTVVSDWRNQACLDATHNCVDYYMEIRKDTASGQYYGWAGILPTPGQTTRTAVLRSQIDKIILSTPTATLTQTGAIAQKETGAVGQTAFVSVSDPTQLRAQFAFSARYTDNALLQKTTGQLLYNQYN